MYRCFDVEPHGQIRLGMHVSDLDFELVSAERTTLGGEAVYYLRGVQIRGADSVSVMVSASDRMAAFTLHYELDSFDWSEEMNFYITYNGPPDVEEVYDWGRGAGWEDDRTRFGVSEVWGGERPRAYAVFRDLSARAP